MSDLQLEVLKIVVGKGLLAIIVAGVAFWLGRLLEAHKAKNAYHQYVAQERVQAFKAVAEQIATDLTDVAYVVDAVTEGRRRPEDDRSAPLLLERFNRFSETYRAHAINLQRQMIFMSRRVGELMIQRQEAVAEFVVLMRDPSTSDEKLRACFEHLGDCTATLQQALAEGLRQPPA